MSQVRMFEAVQVTRTIHLAGTSLELVERGQGRSLLFLHAGEGLAPEQPWLDLLSRHYRVVAPRHPGYGGSPLIGGGAGGVDDLAYTYLDLAGELGLADAVLVGADLGGWIAAEMMVRSTARFSCLVLVAPLGIKLRGRDERDIADFHAMTHIEYLRAAWADPAKGEVDYTSLPDSELEAIVRGREAFALYGWKPYMHNPHLKRWLHRIDRADAAAVGRAGRHRYPFLCRGMAPGNSRCQDRRDPSRRTFPALGTAGGIRPTPRGVRRQPQRIVNPRRSRCASGISPRWPITRPGRKG